MNQFFSPNDILSNKQIPLLPSHLKIGYASWNQCDDKIFTSIQQGLNVIIWFSIDLSTDPQTNKPIITRGPNYEDVAKMIYKIKQNGYNNIIHLISIGGWNSPHPSTNHTAIEYMDTWLNFNRNISKPEYDFYGFDGFDWDIEGNDNFNSSSNHFTIKELDIMGELSVLAKQKGYIVSLAPAESYLDYTTSEFSLSLLYNHNEWINEVPNFNYHGRNTYAYLIKKYGIDVFDFISIQLYEGYTHTLYKYKRQGIKFGKILEEIIINLTKGYEVDFTKVKESGLNKEIITIPNEKIVIGLANAWADKQFLFVNKDDLIEAFDYLKINNITCKGMMFWDLKDEGMIHINDDTKTPFYMAEVINSIYPN
jgi:chitinase